LAADFGGRLRMLHLRPPDTLAARNVGVRAAKGEIVLYVDDDIRCEKDFIAQHAAKYDNPEIGGVGGWIEAPSAKDPWKPEAPFVDSPFGCNMSFRREVLEQVGGFDLRFHSVPSYGEERELAHRIREAGYSIASATAALVFHHVTPDGGQRRRESQDYWKAYAANFVLLFRRTKPLPQQLLFPFWLLKL
jgi:GT2 family glycosyltransferase